MSELHSYSLEVDTSAEQRVSDNIAWMLVLAERILNNRALAEDVVQEAFISAFRGLDMFEGRSSLKTWLHRITVNTSLTRLRQLKRRSEQSIEDLTAEFDQFGCRIEDTWSTLTPIEDILKSEELKTRVHKAIHSLPDSYRIVLLLRDIEGYSTLEVAEQLEISEANVKVRLHRARAALKIVLEPIFRSGEDT